MATEARKRSGNGGDNGRRTRPRGDDGGRTETEDEVEEFFAILRRMHAAAKYFGNGSGNSGRPKEKGARWRPTFEWEDFEGPNGVKSDGDGGTIRRKGKTERKTEEEEERMEENAVLGCLDLNAEPEPDHDAHFSR
ncbi:protein NIM1-INTERACTING 2 [Magnolia sinica]|uniref:protein NIM1-INTERACTING 2 n=1 Tax=Magnolia sinica TaxID=86752 RepID=UPI002659A5D7|nr:protein NIM1-INTERACTING 2 [Magnolia sinica]